MIARQLTIGPSFAYSPDCYLCLTGQPHTLTQHCVDIALRDEPPRPARRKAGTR